MCITILILPEIVYSIRKFIIAEISAETEN